jgi:hypothetical protein
MRPIRTSSDISTLAAGAAAAVESPDEVETIGNRVVTDELNPPPIARQPVPIENTK